MFTCSSESVAVIVICIGKNYLRNRRKAGESDVHDATIVNVPLDVNVWIVCPPLVVFVHPVDDGETQSDPSVA